MRVEERDLTAIDIDVDAIVMPLQAEATTVLARTEELQDLLETDEVGSPGNLRHAPPLIEFGALTFDIVIEITLMYLPYYALPCMWGLIKPKNE